MGQIWTLLLFFEWNNHQFLLDIIARLSYDNDIIVWKGVWSPTYTNPTNIGKSHQGSVSSSPTYQPEKSQ